MKQFNISENLEYSDFMKSSSINGLNDGCSMINSLKLPTLLDSFSYENIYDLNTSTNNTCITTIDVTNYSNKNDLNNNMNNEEDNAAQNIMMRNVLIIHNHQNEINEHHDTLTDPKSHVLSAYLEALNEITRYDVSLKTATINKNNLKHQSQIVNNLIQNGLYDHALDVLDKVIDYKCSNYSAKSYISNESIIFQHTQVSDNFNNMFLPHINTDQCVNLVTFDFNNQNDIIELSEYQKKHLEYILSMDDDNNEINLMDNNDLENRISLYDYLQQSNNFVPLRSLYTFHEWKRIIEIDAQLRKLDPLKYPNVFNSSTNHSDYLYESQKLCLDENPFNIDRLNLNRIDEDIAHLSTNKITDNNICDVKKVQITELIDKIKRENT